MGYTVLPNEQDKIVSLGSLNVGDAFRFASESFEDALEEGEGGVGIYVVLGHNKDGNVEFAPINNLGIEIERSHMEKVIGHVVSFDYQADLLYTQ